MLPPSPQPTVCDPQGATLPPNWHAVEYLHDRYFWNDSTNEVRWTAPPPQFAPATAPHQLPTTELSATFPFVLQTTNLGTGDHHEVAINMRDGTILATLREVSTLSIGGFLFELWYSPLPPSSGPVLLDVNDTVDLRANGGWYVPGTPVYLNIQPLHKQGVPGIAQLRQQPQPPQQCDRALVQLPSPLLAAAVEQLRLPSPAAAAAHAWSPPPSPTTATEPPRPEHLPKDWSKVVLKYELSCTGINWVQWDIELRSLLALIGCSALYD
jgi:hypothetical protein